MGRFTEKLKSMNNTTAVLLAVGAATGILLVNPVQVVKPGERGVVVRLGEVQPVVLKEGPQTLVPFVDKLVRVDVGSKKSEVRAQADLGNGWSLEVVTLVNYHVDYPQAANVYKNYKDKVESGAVVPGVTSAVQSLAKVYPTNGMLASWKSSAQQRLVDTVKETLAKRGLVVESVAVTKLQATNPEAAKAVAPETKPVQVAPVELESLGQAARWSEMKKQGLSSSEFVELERIRMEGESRRLAIEKWDGNIPGDTGGILQSLIGVKR
jgi:hypothetical protein